MPGTLVPARRRRTAELDEEEENGSPDGIATPASLSKRARLDDGAPSESPAGSVLPDSYRTRPRQHVNGDDVDGSFTTEPHQPGAIVRVKLTNFVTYTSVEFHLGPSLNMILGPNGTGKSTLVCAICLGLGWGPQHLGRAKELGEFVRHGAREAQIEIELAAGEKQRGRNPIIQRHIKREGNKSSFSINGQASTQKEVVKLAKSFSIQIDNLCQFLPQDRVVEFAALSPVELLSQTQRAAAPEHMVEWHETLKRMRSEQKKKQAEQATAKDTLQSLQARQNAQKADVERMTERKNLLERVHALERYRPFVQYRLARLRAKEASQQKKLAQRALQQLQQEVEPSLRAVNAKQEYQQQVERVISQRRRLVEKADVAADVLVRKQEELQTKIDDCDNEVQAENHTDRKRKEDVNKLKGSIARLERLMAEEPIEFDPAAYNEKIREKTRRERDLRQRAEEIKQSMGELRDQAQPLQQQVARAQEELKNLKSQTGQQINKLKKTSRDTAQAWEWVQNNQQLFEGKVYGPPIVECSIKDPGYANAVETMLQSNDFLAFTCTSRNDFNTLQEQLYGSLNLSDITIRVANRGLDFWRPPIGKEELQEYGLDAWVLDLLSGPEPVLSMLCDSARFHKTGATLREHTNEQFEKLLDSPIQSWVTGKQTHNVTRRREYGPKAVSTMVRPIKPAKFWTDQPVDVGIERELRQNIAEWNNNIQELEQQNEALKKDLQDAKEEVETVVKERKALEEEKNTKQKARGEYDALPTKHATQQDKLKALEEAGEQHRARLNAIAAKCTKLTLERGQLALDYARAVDTLRTLHNDLFEAELIGIEAASEREILAERNREVKDMLEQKQREVAQIERETNGIRDTAKRTLAEVTAIVEDPNRSDAEQRIHEELGEQRPDITPEELEAEIDTDKTKVEMLHEGNPSAIKQYEKRQVEIDKLGERLASLEDELSRMQADIDELRAKWEPELDRLVGLISEAFAYNFEQIGCAGQVSVHKDEDFDLWSIRISVKFREHEQLSVLDSHRQSGGERAVSTIFYLMALQSLARSPFRVVDEINQGMDPRNERMVHERMVDIACKEHTSQYFLVTPKLLHGLNFHPRMRVHVINSGEHVPADHKKMVMADWAERAVAVMGKA